MKKYFRTLKASTHRQLVRLVVLTAIPLLFSVVQAKPVQRGLVTDAGKNSVGTGPIAMEQRARCKDSELKVTYGPTGFYVSGRVQDKDVNFEFTDSPLGKLMRDTHMTSTPSIGCFGGGFTLEYFGVRRDETGKVSDTFDGMIYRRDAPIQYMSERRPLETITNADGTESIVVTALDPSPPREFETESIADCAAGRFHLLIDHKTKRIFASNDAARGERVELTDSAIGRMPFEKSAFGRMSLSCDVPNGALIEFIGAKGIEVEGEEEGKTIALHFKAKIDTKARLVVDAEVVPADRPQK